jgi:pimeloyl-ACP methyl ester carboxylesterase
MKKILFFLLSIMNLAINSNAQSGQGQRPYEIIKIGSHISGLNLGLLHESASTASGQTPVLFIHGSSFPSALDAGFRMSGGSWMDYLSGHNYETYALDFLGYGNSDRYPDIPVSPKTDQPPGRATEIYKDIDSAVNYIIKRTGSRKINIIAHSWGCTVAELYASKYPDKVQNLVLFAPYPPGKRKEPSTIIDYSYSSMTPMDRVNSMKSLTPPGHTSQLEPELFDKWQKQWSASDPQIKADGKVHFPSGWEADVDDMDHGKPYYDPTMIRSSVLIIRGEWDTTPTNDAANRLFEQLTNASNKRYVTIAKSTHVMHLEKDRGQLYRETLDFLNQTPMQPSTKSIAVIFEVIPADGRNRNIWISPPNSSRN